MAGATASEVAMTLPATTVVGPAQEAEDLHLHLSLRPHFLFAEKKMQTPRQMEVKILDQDTWWEMGAVISLTWRLEPLMRRWLAVLVV